MCMYMLCVCLKIKLCPIQRISVLGKGAIVVSVKENTKTWINKMTSSEKKYEIPADGFTDQADEDGVTDRRLVGPH